MNRPAHDPEGIRVAEDIVPIAEFKAHLSEMVSGLSTRRRPVIITQNGKPAAVILSPAEFDRLAYHARFVSAANEGIEDVRQGRAVSDKDAGKLLDERYGGLTKAKAKTKRR